MRDEHLEASVAVLQRRALFTVLSFGAIVVAGSVELAARGWCLQRLTSLPAEDLLRHRGADTIANLGFGLGGIGLLVTAILFLRWAHRLVLVAQQLGADVRMRPASIVTSFIIPLVNLWRPYKMFSRLSKALDPDSLPPPETRVDPAAMTDYRSAVFASTSRPDLPRPLLGLWWTGWILMTFSGELVSRIRPGASVESQISAHQSGIVHAVLEVIAALLAITVVRGLTARAGERLRRMSV